MKWARLFPGLILATCISLTTRTPVRFILPDETLCQEWRFPEAVKYFSASWQPILFLFSRAEEGNDGHNNKGTQKQTSAVRSETERWEPGHSESVRVSEYWYFNSDYEVRHGRAWWRRWQLKFKADNINKQTQKIWAGTGQHLKRCTGPDSFFSHLNTKYITAV